MEQMGEFFDTLEGFQNLEASTIRSTKMHKVLKAIIKLNFIPKDEVYQFKKRSADLLKTYNQVLNTESGTSTLLELPSAELDKKAVETVPNGTTTETHTEDVTMKDTDAEEPAVTAAVPETSSTEKENSTPVSVDVAAPKLVDVAPATAAEAMETTEFDEKTPTNGIDASTA